MSADELNDLYYKLPVRKPSEDDGPGALDYNLSVIQGADRNENDGNRADSSIAIARKWKPSHTGTNEGSDVSYLDIDDATGGKIVSVADNDGNTYSHGMKVPKYTDLTINAIPDDGNVLEGFRLNGEPVIKGCTFMMPGIYTRLTPVFSPKAGLANTTAGRLHHGSLHSRRHKGCISPGNCRRHSNCQRPRRRHLCGVGQRQQRHRNRENHSKITLRNLSATWKREQA